MNGVPEISVHDLPADAVLLDVREPDEWSAGHVDGAVHVPFSEVPARLGRPPRGRRRSTSCAGRATGPAAPRRG